MRRTMQQRAVKECPVVPPPAERARSIADRPGPVTVAVSTSAGEPDPMSLPPAPRRVNGDGSVSVVVPDDHPLIAYLADTAEQRLDAATELIDVAPAQLREPVRGLVWANGSIRLLPPAEARAAAVAIATVNPDENLLDVGFGLSVVAVDPVFVAVADGDGGHGVERSAFLAARPDPLLEWELRWLPHLDSHHGDVLDRIAVRLGTAPETLRPAGIDRYGLRLRIEVACGSYDLRLPFSQPVDTPREAVAELHQLTGCRGTAS